MYNPLLLAAVSKKEIEMYETLKAGLTFEFDYTVPESKTVPYIYPEAEEFQLMPKVFSTGFMIGLIEWACVKFVLPKHKKKLSQQNEYRPIICKSAYV